MPTNTTTYSFQKPVVGADEDSWGGYLNSNWDKVDDLFDGTVAITGIDINSGTIDGTVIGGSSAAAITGTTITGTSFVSSGDMTFGDNDKAIFGAGSDLQIYHDGSHSYVSDQGTGNLRLLAGNFQVNTAGNDGTYIRAGNASDVELFYGGTGGTVKLATTATGVDITGTLTSDGLTVGSSTLTESASDLIIDAVDDLFLRANGQDAIRIFQDASSLQNIGFRNTAQDGSTLLVNGNGDISFYEDTGTTAKFFWDSSAESLGIGHSSPSYKLDVRDSSSFLLFASTDATTGSLARIRANGGTTEVLEIQANGNVGIGTSSPNASSKLHVEGGAAEQVQIRVSQSDNTGAYLFSQSSSSGVWNADNTPLLLATNNTERMRINSSGNVLIGSSNAPTGYARVSLVGGEASGSGANSGIQLTYNSGAYGGGAITTVNAAGGGLDFYRFTGNVGSETYSHSMRIDSSGNVGIGTSSPAVKLHVDGGDIRTTNRYLAGSTGVSTPDYSFASDGSMGMYRVPGSLCFSTGGTERMRIDSSGSLMVGTTDPSIYDDTSGNGFSVYSSGIGTFKHQAVNSSDPCLILNDTGVDSQLLQFRKGGATVGSIGTLSSRLHIENGDTGLRIAGDLDQIFPCGSGGADRDNAIDLGSTGVRFDDIYATNGTIQTSDEREKQDIEALSDAEQRVAVAAKGLLRKFRWKDAVAEKGDDARIHFGIIAQDLQAAFAAEGLDAGDYAMFIHTTWTDEETGEEKSRMGVRYSELLAFIIAAI